MARAPSACLDGPWRPVYIPDGDEASGGRWYAFCPDFDPGADNPNEAFAMPNGRAAGLACAEANRAMRSAAWRAMKAASMAPAPE
jgi:hypothetical protein